MNVIMKSDATAALLSKIGKRIKHNRHRAGMTQQALADQVGIFRTYLSRIESGVANPTIVVLATIAQKMSVDLESLLVETVSLPRR